MPPMDPLGRAASALPRTTALPGSITLDARVPLASLSVGEEVTARVLSDRPGGRFIALIDGRQVEIALPAAARAGDNLKLVVVADQPRLLLAPAGDGNATVSGAGSALSRQAAAASAAGLASAGAAPDADATSAAAGREVAVSAEGRALGRLVGDIANAARDAGARAAGGGVAPAAPLVAQPSDEPAVLTGQLASALTKTLSGSGLFYESHQAQWIAGRRSLEALRAEPQGRLEPLAPRPEGESMAGRATARASAQASAEPARAVAAALARDATALSQPPGAVAGSTLDATVDPAAALLVQQQLTALDTGAATWSGQVLPGMHARLTVHERAQEPEGEGDGTESSGWSTRLSVSLPRLGSVDAQLLLRGDRLVLAVAASEAGSAAELAAARERLVETLRAAGLQVDSLQVTLR